MGRFGSDLPPRGPERVQHHAAIGSVGECHGSTKARAKMIDHLLAWENQENSALSPSHTQPVSQTNGTARGKKWGTASLLTRTRKI